MSKYVAESITMIARHFGHKGLCQLRRPTVNRPLPRDPTVKVENKIADTLKRLRNQGHLDHRLCDFLIPQYSTPPQMYGLPKVHKEDTPMRPIVSTINSPSYKLAKELARILTPLAGNTAYTVRNSTAFVERIRGLRLHHRSPW